MNNLEKEIFNQYILDSLEKDILTPKLATSESLDIAPSKLGLPGTLGIMKTVSKHLVDNMVNEKEEDDNFRAHTYFDLNFKLKNNNTKLKFDLSFVLYYKIFTSFDTLNFYNIHKYINKKIINKKKEILKQYNTIEDSYENKQYNSFTELKSYLNSLYNSKQHVGLTLVIEKIVSLLNNGYNGKAEIDSFVEYEDITENKEFNEIFEENQFLINKDLFLENGLTEVVYNETINLLTANDGQLYKEFFNEMPPSYHYKPIEINLINLEYDLPTFITENSEFNQLLNQDIINYIKEELKNIISKKNINIFINKKMTLMNFLSRENYQDFINESNIHQNEILTNILIYYPKIKIIKNDYNLKIITCGTDYISTDKIKAIPLFDDRVFNTRLTIYFDNKDLNIFKYSADNHYKYKDTKAIYCQSNHIATFYPFEDNLTIKTTWNPKYYLPRNKNTGINDSQEQDSKLFAYSTWSKDRDIDFSIIEKIPQKYKKWVENIPLSMDTKLTPEFKEDLEKWNTEIENITLGIELLKFSYQNRGNPRLSPVFDSWKYLNQTFCIIEPTKYTEWRLFQFCFLLSLIPSIALKNSYIINEFCNKSNYTQEVLQNFLIKAQDSVNLLFFNAGGGKTEAFLSIIIYTMFFERLTGITHGLSAIIKYPLRLLLTQQTHRVLKAIGSAELIRQKIKFNQIEQKFDSSFSLGIWVGSSSTPNSIDSDVKRKVLEILNNEGLNFGPYDLSWENNLLKNIWNTNHSDENEDIKKSFIKNQINDFRSHKISNWDLDEGVESLDKYFDIEEEQYQKIDTCPFCDSHDITIRIYKKTLFHFCLNKKCDWNHGNKYRGLPFYIVDDNVYEKSPTVIISTTDKLSKMGYLTKSSSNLEKEILPDNRKVLGIFGIAPYFNLDEKKYTWTNDKKSNIMKLFDSKSPEKIVKFPSWIIQDETHLLTESLGSFSAIFERNFSHTILEIQKKLKEFVINYNLPYVIASTATMASPEKQLLPIYDKKNICLFPAIGYKLYENFYSKPEEKPSNFSINNSFNEFEKYHISRIYNGYILNEVAYFKLANFIALLHHKKLKDLWENNIAKEDFINSIKNTYYKNIAITLFNSRFNFDEYIKENVLYNKILINYTGNKNTNEKLKKWENDICTLNGDFKDVINNYNQVSITSDVNITDLSNILEIIKMQSLEFGTNEDRKLRSIFATQSISHGVDSPQFNSMIFHGFPEFINEYIQASARIGRTNVGYVTTLPLKNNKDKLIMSNFEYFHRFIDRPVLANTIDFKTQTIIEKTLPSLFISWYVNVESLSIDSLDKIKIEVLHNSALFEKFFKFIFNMLDVKFDISLPEISDIYVNSLKDLLEKQWGKLMTSLRDTEKNAKLVIGEKNDKK